jgi:ACT domain-containing protein
MQRRPSEYLKPRRTAAINAIRNMIVSQAKNPSEIMNELGLSHRTFYRYLDIAFKDQSIEYDRLITEQDLTHYVSVYQKRLQEAFTEMTDLSRDRSVDPKERVPH